MNIENNSRKINPLILIIPFVLFIGSLSSSFAQKEERVGCSENDLRNWFKEKLKTTQNSFKSYHWGSRVGASFSLHQQLKTKTFPYWKETLQTNDWDGKLPLNSETRWSKNYFYKMSSNFYYDDLAKGDPRLNKIFFWDVGMGLYTALEPIQSISFAGGNWILLEVTVPKGVTYLDYNEHTAASFGPCGKFLGFQFSFVGDSDDKEFRKMFWRLILEYNVQFIHYRWRKISPVELCEEGNQFGAFNFINPKLMDVPGFGLKLFTKYKGLKNQKSRFDYLEMAKKLILLNQISFDKYDKVLREFGWNSLLKNDYFKETDTEVAELLNQYRSEFFECNYHNPAINDNQ